MTLFTTFNPMWFFPSSKNLNRAFAATSILLVLAVLMTASNSTAAEGEIDIGVTTATQRTPIGQPPKSDRRQLVVGINVVNDERVTTGDSDLAQLLFLDGSSITVGPNSNIILDEFVYDPDVEIGQIIVRATKGVFRFVGGKISKRGVVEFRTPSGAIGIRGGIAIIEVGANGSLDADFLFGENMFLESGGVRKTTYKPGSFMSAKAGGAPSNPLQRDATSLKAKLSNFEGSASATRTPGGPQDGRAAPGAGQIAGTGPIDGLASNLSKSYTDNGLEPILLPGVPVVTENGIQDASQGITTDAVEDDPLASASKIATLDGAALRISTRGTDWLQSTGAISAGRLFDVVEVKSLDPTTGGELTATAPAGNYTLYFPGTSVASPTTLSACPTTSSPCTVQFPGSIGNEDGVITFDANRELFSYLITLADGSRELVLAGTPYVGQIPTSGVQTYNLTLIANEPPSTTYFRDQHLIDTQQQAHIFWGSANTVSKPFLSTSIVIDEASKSLALSALIGRVSLETGGGVTSAQSITGTFYGIFDPPADNFMATVPQDASVGFSNSGTFNSVGINGTVANGAGDFFGTTAPNFFALWADPAINSPRAYAYKFPYPGLPLAGHAITASDPGNGMIPGADSYFPINVAAPAQTSLLPTRSLTNLQGFATAHALLGGARAVLAEGTATPGGSSTFVVWPSADSVTATINTLDLVSSKTISAATTAASTSAYIDDNNFAATLETASENGVVAGFGGGGLVTGANTVSGGTAFDLCNACAFLTWGFWALAIENEGAVGVGVDQYSGGLGNWVAGQVVPPGSFPQTGSITYAGDVVGDVTDGNEFYVATATGGISMDVAFGPASYAVTNFGFSFDGANYAGLASGAVSNAQNYTVTGADGGRFLSADGYFYGPNAENTGGQFSVTDVGADYFAVGVYAGADVTLPP